MESDEENKLVERCREGCQNAFRRLFHHHHQSTYRVACRLSGSHHDAEEILQEAWAKAWNSIERFAGRSRFGTWIMRIVINCAADHGRRRGRRPSSQSLSQKWQTDSKSARPEDHVVAGELEEKLQGELTRLPDEQRVALVLVAFEGHSYAEAARIMKCPEGTLAWRIARAREKLSERLAPHLDGYD